MFVVSKALFTPKNPFTKTILNNTKNAITITFLLLFTELVISDIFTPRNNNSTTSKNSMKNSITNQLIAYDIIYVTIPVNDTMIAANNATSELTFSDGKILVPFNIE